MNWRRGFFRLWLVLSALWVVPVGLFIAGTYKPMQLLAEPLAWWLMLGPPAVALVLLTAAGWALKGFREVR